jgi:hypothetical protein
LKQSIPKSFTIPDTIEGVSGLLTARKWEKAAIVYAWTMPQQGTSKQNRRSGLYTFADFASLEIVGLTNAQTVASYRNAWVWAIEQGLAPMVEPGDTIDFMDLGTVGFPPTGNAAYPKSPYDDDYAAEAEKVGVSKDAARRSGSNKAGAKAAYKADPEFRRAIQEAEQERSRENYERIIRERAGAGVPRDVIEAPGGRRSKDSPAANAMDYAVEEVERLEAIRELVRIAQTGKVKMQELSARFSHTGVGDEVDLLHEMSGALTDWQWAATSFIVEPAGGAR